MEPALRTHPPSGQAAGKPGGNLRWPGIASGDPRAPVAQWIEQVPSKHLVASLPGARELKIPIQFRDRVRGPGAFG
jgi:hypothetical protein